MPLYNENKEIYSLVIDNIKEYRKLRGLTQEGLALRAHISKGYLSQIEARNYAHFCSLDVIISIAKALDVPLYRLFLPSNVVMVDEELAAALNKQKIQQAYEELCREAKNQEQKDEKLTD